MVILYGKPLYGLQYFVRLSNKRRKTLYLHSVMQLTVYQDEKKRNISQDVINLQDKQMSIELQCTHLLSTVVSVRFYYSKAPCLFSRCSQIHLKLYSDHSLLCFEISQNYSTDVRVRFFLLFLWLCNPYMGFWVSKALQRTWFFLSFPGKHLQFLLQGAGTRQLTGRIPIFPD